MEAVNGNITSQLETINRTATYVYLNDAYESQESAFGRNIVLRMFAKMSTLLF